MENRIDQIFKEKLENFERNPPVGLLDQINQQIAYRTRIRRINQVKTVLSIAAALVLVLLAGWYAIDNNQMADNTVPVQVQEKEVMQPAVKTEPLAAIVSPAVPTNASRQIASKSIHAQSGGSTKKYQVKPQQPSSNASETKSETASTSVIKEAVTSPPSISDQTNQQKDPGAVKRSATRQKNAEPLYFSDSYNPDPRRNQKSSKGSWEVKAELSPMFTSSGLVGNSSSKSMGTMSGGMMASYRLNKKVSISSGIRFAQMKQGTHTDYFLNAKSGITYLEPVEKNANISRDVSLYLPSTSSIVYANGMQAAAATNVINSDISQDFKYLEIPVQATYKLIDNTLSLGITGGISTNILIGNIASITENGIKLSQGSTDNLRDVIYSGSAGIELGYGLAKNLTLTVEPRLKQYMHSVSSNDLINFKPLQMGIFTGITYTFD